MKEEARSAAAKMTNNVLPQQHWKLKAHLLTLYVVHETEGSSTKRSSKAGNLRGGLAHLEHRRPDGWTCTPRGSDDEKNCSERDETSSHPLVRTGGEEDAHEIITNTHCGSSCDLWAGERLPKQRPLGDEHPERIPETSWCTNDTPGRRGRFYRVTQRPKLERVQERQQGNAGYHVCCSKKGGMR